ncbi:MAG: lysozyme inhibitor LprI family protein [Pararhizobium sp.]
MRGWVAALAALLALGTAERAGDCSKAQDQAALNDCARAALHVSDAALNDAFRQIKARLAGDPETLKLLVAAQKQWIAFRDSECTFASSNVAQGSIYPMVVDMCLDGLTKKRLADFRAYLSCREGDLSCPVPAQ